MSLLKKRLWHRCFTVNFVNLLRTPPVAASVKGDLSNSQSENERLFLSASVTTKFQLVFILTQKMLLNSTKSMWVFLKSGTRDLQNNPPLKRLAYFYESITGNFQRFQYVNFETNFLKNEKVFQNTGVRCFS